jgi:hypothetical protein
MTHHRHCRLGVAAIRKELREVSQAPPVSVLHKGATVVTSVMLYLSQGSPSEVCSVSAMRQGTQVPTRNAAFITSLRYTIGLTRTG